MLKHKLNQKQRDIEGEREAEKDKKAITKKRIADIEARLKAVEEKLK